MTTTVKLAAGDYRLLLDPGRGGSVVRFTWRGHDLFRAAQGGSVLDAAYFPMVPFCNRINSGRFRFEGRPVILPPNMPAVDRQHPLHGFGWISVWEVIEREPAMVRLRLRVDPGAWPWCHEAEQCFRLDGAGLRIHLSVRNLDLSAMPVGLGFHPYFPGSGGAVCRGRHRGVWTVSQNHMPVSLEKWPQAIDRWTGQPITARSIDTAFVDREGPLTVEWPHRRIGLELRPSATMPNTFLFVPEDRAFFCVEPATHVTNAVNHSPSSMHRLLPGAKTEVSMDLAAYQLAPDTYLARPS